MKKIILTLFLLFPLSIFSSEKLQELRPCFEELVSASFKNFEAVLNDSFICEFGKPYDGSFLAYSDTYTETMMNSAMEPSPEMKELLSGNGDEASASSSIVISLEEVQPNYFVLTLNADGRPDIIEGDSDYMKVFIPFLRDEIKKTFSAN